ncbi:hypothetical protein [Ensifer sp. Root278]|uniref:hypothetical protein n=1 Tax=Ensifer sp. Root278 TaxID=1736509 RepID=UPI00070C159F|nr:hypothetical protein [Ensifer sp. Root278]KRD63439.1 hypothetical protein ASE60_31350 [Ensifer sp. Root278]
MKFSLLITGQVRNMAVFEGVTSSAKAAADFFEKIVYCGWDDQVATAKSLLAHNTSIECVGAGYLLPLGSGAESSLVSFLAQHQQISCGLRAIGPGTFVIRIRADSAHITAERLHYLCQLMALSGSRHDLQGKSVVLGASDRAPFFFDDRTMFLSPLHQSAILGIDLSSIYRVDPVNFFPEFLFYSSLAFANKSPGRLTEFCSFDHRFRHYENCVQSVMHGISVFGENGYGEGCAEYLEFAKDHFLFLADLVAEFSSDIGHPPEGMMSSLCNSFHIYNMNVLLSSFERNSQEYRSEFDTVMSGVSENTSSVFRVTDKEIAVEAKSYLNTLRRAVAAGQDSTQPMPERLSSASIAPIIRFYQAKSLKGVGGYEAGKALISKNLDLGYSTPRQDDLLQEIEQALNSKLKPESQVASGRGE